MSNNFIVNSKRVPRYYQILIKLLRPVYQLMLWQRHNKAKKSGTNVLQFADECNQRFAKHLPIAPKLPASFTPNNKKTNDVQLQTPKAEPSSQNTWLNVKVWCHAVSLGETNTIAPMINEMLNKGAVIWLTNTTQTGYAQSKKLFAAFIKNGQLVHTFVPIDDKSIMIKFLQHFRPNLALFIETELWATTLELLTQQQILSVLVNARLSQKSFENYMRFSKLSQSMMTNISMIIAQDTESAKRFRMLGADAFKIRVTDSLKWATSDNTAHSKVNLEPTFIANNQALARPIWVAGSTHSKEEAWVVNVQKLIVNQLGLQNTLLILVPRHPERFEEVADLLEESGLIVHRRSQNELIDENTQIYLVDTMGELESCYKLADVAFVGGSLVNIGGHNPVEASRMGKPVVMGHFTQSCNEVVKDLANVGALKQIEEFESGSNIIESLQRSVCDWLLNPHNAKAAGERGRQLVLNKQLAMTKQLTIIETLLQKTVTHSH